MDFLQSDGDLRLYLIAVQSGGYMAADGCQAPTPDFRMYQTVAANKPNKVSLLNGVLGRTSLTYTKCTFSKCYTYLRYW